MRSLEFSDQTNAWRDILQSARFTTAETLGDGEIRSWPKYDFLHVKRD